MSSWLLVSSLVCAAACFDPRRPSGGSDALDDERDGMGPSDSGSPGAWSAPGVIAIAGDPGRNENDGTLSHSGLELVYMVSNGSDKDLHHAVRPDLDSAFLPASRLPFSIAGPSEETPRFSLDDRTLYFAKTNDPNQLDIYRVARPAPGGAQWGTPELVSEVSTTAFDKGFVPCADGRYFMIRGNNVFEGVLGTSPPVAVAALNTAATETGVFATPDCLTIWFASSRSGSNQLYTSSRSDLSAAWSPPIVFDAFATTGGNQSDPFVADDQRTFVFTSDAAGGTDIYIATR